MHVLVHFFLEAARESHFGKFRAREKDFLMNSLDFEIVFVAVRVVNIGSNCLQLRYVREYAVKDCGKTSREYGECTAHQTCYYVKKCSSKAAARTKKGLKEA